MLQRDRRKSKSCCTVFFLVILVAGVVFALYLWLHAGHVPSRVVLEVDFDRGMTEYLPDDPLARALLSKKLIVREVVEALRMASEDSRVRGLVARMGGTPLRLAQVQEVRDAVIAFRASGKPAVAYAETFGEAGPGNSSYYLATAFDEIYLQPSGDVGLTGLMYEQPFFRGTLDKLGIVPRIEARKQYKSFKYIFTERRYVPPHREEVTAVMDSQFGQIVKAISEARRIPEQQVRPLIDRGPFIGREAADAGLVDGLKYRDEVYARIKDRAGAKSEFFDLVEYRQRVGSPYEKGTTIALIYGVGGIERGKSGYNPLTGGITMGSDTVAAAFRKAAEDKDVKAILFRIDSPGGSYVASDALWRETVRVRKEGKPIIVSMGGTAASGGYFIAVAADKIVAQPATITGSIGVLGGKMITTGFWKKLGVTWDEVHTSTNADAWTQIRDLTPSQKARFSQWLDRIYDDFITKVGEGRNMAKDRVDEVAKGRIWTGEDAKRLGLVDELGGFPAALHLVRTELKLADDAALRIKIYPEERGWLSRIADLGFFSSKNETSEALRRAFEDLQPLARSAESLGLTSRSAELRMPDLNLE